VADELGVHYMTAYRYVRTGRLRATRRNGRWVVTRPDLDAFRRGGAPPPGRRGAAGKGGAPGLAAHRDRLLERLLAGDEPGAWQVVESALVGGLGPDEAPVELLAPCLREVGDRWADGVVTVGTEHIASATAARLVARLAPLSARRGRTQGAVVLGAPPDEQHGLPMALLANVLRARGWDVVELGPDTPSSDLLDAARSTDRLAAVGVSVGSSGTLEAARRVLADLRAHLPGVPLLAGGPALPDLTTARRLGADGWGADAEAVHAELSRLAERTP
jgi:methanogenic corrinoid protein MtbC1